MPRWQLSGALIAGEVQMRPFTQLMHTELQQVGVYLPTGQGVATLIWTNAV